MEKLRKTKWFSGFSVGMLAMFILMAFVGLVVWAAIYTFGAERFDAALSSATPYFAGIRGLVYCLILAGWKKVCGYLAGGNSELYQALVQRRLLALGLILVVELVVIIDISPTLLSIE